MKYKLQHACSGVAGCHIISFGVWGLPIGPFLSRYLSRSQWADYCQVQWNINTALLHLTCLSVREEAVSQHGGCRNWMNNLMKILHHCWKAKGLSNAFGHALMINAFKMSALIITLCLLVKPEATSLNNIAFKNTNYGFFSPRHGKTLSHKAKKAMENLRCFVWI